MKTKDDRKAPGAGIRLERMMGTPKPLSEAAQFFFDVKPHEVKERQANFQEQCNHGGMKLKTYLVTEERAVYYYCCDKCGAVIPRKSKV